MIARAQAQDKRPAPPVSREPILSGLIQRCGGKACPPGTCDQEAVRSSRAYGGVGHDFSRVRVHTEVDADTGTASRGAVQAKLRIGQVDDPLEHEADRAAEQVTRTPRLGVAATSPQLSRRYASSGEENRFQALPADSRSAVGEAPGVVHQVLRSPGQPLDATSRAYFEPRFGYDFSKVRVHADEQAAESARALDALAFTAGHHVVFGTGSYGHDTEARRKLLAHELAHAVQQSHQPDAAHSGATLQRAPADEKSPALPEISEKTNPQDSPRYIDELFQSVTPPSMINGAITFFWEQGGVKKEVTIPQSDLEQNDKLTFVALWKIHASKAEALKMVELYQKDGSGFAYYSFYLGKDGVIMPTSFSRLSTPNFHALWPDLIRANAEKAADIAAGFRQLGNAINPFPCTELDEKGDLRPAINFTNCTLPILLHGYSIHSARGKPGLPSESHTPPVETESHAPPPKKPAPPKPPAAGESPKPPVTTGPVPTEPAKTEPVPTEPAKTEAAKTEPEKTEPKPATVRTPAELERHLEQLGLTSEEIRGLAGGKRRGQFSQARAALIERLLGHFKPQDMKVLGKYFAEMKLTLNKTAVDAFIGAIAPGEAGDWVKTRSIAEVYGKATRPPEAEGAREESLGEEQDPNARISATKKKPSPGPEPRAFLRGNFAHRFAEYLLDALRLPRPSRAEVVVELRDGTGDIIRPDRIISDADHGVLLEIKPAGRSAEIGQAQLPGRLEALQREYPKRNGWTGRVVEYTPADVRAWLQREAQAARAAGSPVPDVEGIMKLLGF